MKTKQKNTAVAGSLHIHFCRMLQVTKKNPRTNLDHLSHDFVMDLLDT